MRKYITILTCYVLSILFLTAVIASAQGAKVRAVKLPGKAKELSVNLSASDKGLEKIIFYATSAGNSTQRFEFTIGSTATITTKVYSRAVTSKKNLENSALASTGWNALKFQVNGDYLSSVSLNKPASPTKPGGNGKKTEERDPSCACLTASEIQSMLEMYRQMGISISKDEMCNNFAEGKTQDCNSYGGDTTTGDDGTQTWTEKALGVGILQKNTCASKYTYLAKVEVDLRKIDDADFDKGFVVKASLAFKDYNGDEAATLKPAADGRFAPDPIILITAISWGYSEEVRAVYWRGTKMSRQIKLTTGEIKSICGARCRLMHLRDVRSVMGGGKAVIELVKSDNPTAYSHCFTMSRTRQNRGGYG